MKAVGGLSTLARNKQAIEMGLLSAKSSLTGHLRNAKPLLYLCEGGPVPPPGGGGAGGRGGVGGGVDRGHAPTLPFSLQLLEGSV